MSLIKKPTEIQSKKTIACMIYGQPGMGKSTLACSAPKPVMFDFDGGVTRMRDEHQVPTVQIATFQDALDALKEVEAAGDEYQTIIVDTASKLIDCITTHVCGTAQPKIQQWGLINAAFKSFLRSIQSMGKHVVFVAQREVEKDGDVNRYVPQFRQSNYKDVICDLDVCGYMEMVQVRGKEVRQITFNPSSRNEGKNTANFKPAYIIADLPQGADNTFLSERIAEYISRQNERDEKRSVLAKETEEKMKAFNDILMSATTPESLNEIVKEVKDAKPVGDLKMRMVKAISAHAKKMGFTFNKETKEYEQI